MMAKGDKDRVRNKNTQQLTKDGNGKCSNNKNSKEQGKIKSEGNSSGNEGADEGVEDGEIAAI